MSTRRVDCAYPGCANTLLRSDFDEPQFCSKEHRDGVPLVEFKTSESMSRDGWYIVKQKKGSALWEVVASVFGEARAEVVRAALEASS